MNEQQIRQLLEKLSVGGLSVAQVLEHLRTLPFEDLGFAKIDHHRALRRGFPEVIYAEGKTAEQIIDIAERIRNTGTLALATRTDRSIYDALAAHFGDAVSYDHAAQMAWVGQLPMPDESIPPLLILSAGTADLPVTRQATLMAKASGCPVLEILDVGVAGLHRLLHYQAELDRAGAIVVVAGMEGALPSVVSGLASVPVIAVPTSVGYGASFGGLAALLGMLNSCAGGVAVVNIDNGFGAGMIGTMICKQSHKRAQRLPD
jgi:NCAIR mutase (PurE)-related protein